jgi:peptidoglycan hydrolase CwlO-like protein
MGFLWGLIELISIVALIIGLFYLYSKKNKENPQKRKQGRYLSIFGLIALFLSGFIFSKISDSQSNTTKINGEKVTYNQLQKKVEALKNDKTNLESDVEEQTTKLSDLKSQHKDVMDAIANLDKTKQQVSDNQDKLAEVKSNIDDANSELKSVDSKISTAKSELSTVNGQVIAAKSAPKTLTAGRYVVGKDVPEGRYKAVPQGSGSNFFVYDSGDPVVNTILGSDGEPSYVFEATDGEEIQTESTVKLIPIK